MGRVVQPYSSLPHPKDGFVGHTHTFPLCVRNTSFWIKDKFPDISSFTRYQSKMSTVSTKLHFARRHREVLRLASISLGLSLSYLYLNFAGFLVETALMQILHLRIWNLQRPGRNFS